MPRKERNSIWPPFLNLLCLIRFELPACQTWGLLTMPACHQYYAAFFHQKINLSDICHFDCQADGACRWEGWYNSARQLVRDAPRSSLLKLRSMPRHKVIYGVHPAHVKLSDDRLWINPCIVHHSCLLYMKRSSNWRDLRVCSTIT